jgi:hypothetical protein
MYTTIVSVHTTASVFSLPTPRADPRALPELLLHSLLAGKGQ